MFQEMEEEANDEKNEEAEAKRAEGTAAFEKNDLPKAIELYWEALDLNEDHYVIHADLASVYI